MVLTVKHGTYTMIINTHEAGGAETGVGSAADGGLHNSKKRSRKVSSNNKKWTACLHLKNFKLISHGGSVEAGGWVAGGWVAGGWEAGGWEAGDGCGMVGGEVLAGWAYTFKWLN